MMRVGPALGLVALLSVPAGAQTPATFELADVRASASGPITGNGLTAPNTTMREVAPRNGRYEVRLATMVDLVRLAYGVEADKVVGGPHWLELDRYDIIAKVPEGTRRELTRPMLKALLAERFSLVVKEEIKPVAAQTLVRSGELKAKEAPATATTCQRNLQQGAVNAGGIVMVMTCRGVSMASFAELLMQTGGPMLGVTGPIVDATGLAGGWDFDLRFTPAQLASQTGGTFFPEALEKQVGLKLEKKDVPLPLIAVASVNRTPTANDAVAVAAAFPPGPSPEFDVANLKRSAPGTRANMQTLPNGTINFSNLPLRTLIGLAWEAQNEGSIVGPKSLDNTFDMVGRMAGTAGPVDATQLDRQQIGLMIQKVLVDQLNLKAHWEERPATGYSLVVDGSHKLVKADPSVRTRCTTNTASGGAGRSGGVTTIEATMVCQNVTLAEFIARVPQINISGLGAGALQAPMADDTGLDGRWTFTLRFVPPGLERLLATARGLGAAAGAAGVGASDPTGVMTFEEAVDRQLGLKLRQRPRQARVLVVDAVDDPPAGN